MPSLLIKKKIPTTLLDWPECKVRRASISNFGAGGANTHVIIEDPTYLVGTQQKASSNGILPPHSCYRINGTSTTPDGTSINGKKSTNGKPEPCERLSAVNGESTPTNGHHTVEGPKAAKRSADHADFSGKSVKAEHADQLLVSESPVGDQSFIVTLSARDETSLKVSAQRLAHSLSLPHASWSLPDLAYTMNERRTHFPWRLAVQSSSLPALQEELTSHTLKPVNAQQKPRLGFVFTGQGAQWFAMGRELIYAYPIFREALQEGGTYMRWLGAQWDPIGKTLFCVHCFNNSFSQMWSC
jgi:acyl transferase domain-containing protein